ncbi:MAG: alpha-L-rhamnosidase C-terminal domain-containing protein [Coriobacteriales bacterium]|nr:alpha-L-rhamnosidase C-terminal domain-containing protein [Coriobacteriales bacterium]
MVSSELLSVYHLTCAGLREPMGITRPPMLSWRVGSGRDGAAQATCRVVVTSMADGSTCWDSGVLRTQANEVRYAGRVPAPGTACVWFVTITSEQGERACSVPASFVWGERGDVVRGTLRPYCEGCIWASDGMSCAVPRDGVVRADDPLWEELVGVAHVEHDSVRITLPAWVLGAEQPCFVQGSMLASRGLLVVRWERRADKCLLQITVPPGMTATVELGAQTRSLHAGRHALVV